jgi:hypothetical protein
VSSVPKPRSVIDLVEDWYLLWCRNPACRRAIDVNWLRQSGDSSFSWADDSWADAETLLRHCPECIVNSAPEDAKPTVAAFYDRIRAVRHDIGHGEATTPSVTLSVTKWHLPPTSKGRARDGRDDPYSEEYSIKGGIFHPEGKPPDFKGLSWFPLYSVELAQPPALVHTPAGEPIFWAQAATPISVRLALYAFHPKVPGAHRRFVWDPSEPTREYFLLTHGWRGLSATQLHVLENETLKLFEAARGRSSGTGNYERGEENRFLEDVERVLTRHEAEGIRITTKAMLADKVGTLGKTQFYAMLKRVPEARERYQEHKRKPLR